MQLAIPDALALARQHRQAGRWTEAAEIYRLILDARPDHEEARRDLAVLGHLAAVDSHASLERLHRTAATDSQINGRRYLDELLADPRYADPRRLERFGFKCFSQNDEDGIVQEIFRRIGTGSRTFVEFGVQTGLENNSLLLLHQGWRGGWIEGSGAYVEHIRNKFRPVIDAGRLKILHSFITRENIDALLGRLDLPREIDLLSIDIDGNDYYVFEAISTVSPRLVVIEYNAKLPPPARLVIPYDPANLWRGGDYFGASLAALTDLAQRKGYRLVGCNVTGANAFFVRADLAGSHFQEPCTAENFHHPPRYFLTETAFMVGHRPDFGVYETT